VLPALALLYLLPAAVLSRGKVGAALLVLLSTATVAETALKHPDYLGFFNLAAKPPYEQIALDSNLDWGQDLARLAHLVANEQLPEGESLSAIYPLGDRQAALFRVLDLDATLLDNAEPRPGSLIAVSLTRAAYGPGEFGVLKESEVVARVGTGIVIYRLPRAPSSEP
jgi:hypothetical protein